MALTEQATERAATQGLDIIPALVVATRPKHVCLNEVLVSPTWNRGYVRQLENLGM